MLTITPTFSVYQIPCITNELILKLLRFKNLHSECSFKTLFCWVKDLFGKKWPLPDSPTCQAVIKSIDRLNARFAKLKKKQHSSSVKEMEIAHFLQEEFLLPKLGYRKGKIVNFSPAKSSAKSQHQSVKMYKGMKQKLYAANRNANKRLKRREAKIQEQEKLIHNYEQQLCGIESKLKKMRMKLDRVNHRASYWETKAYESRSETHNAGHYHLTFTKVECPSKNMYSFAIVVGTFYRTKCWRG